MTLIKKTGFFISFLIFCGVSLWISNRYDSTGLERVEEGNSPLKKTAGSSLNSSVIEETPDLVSSSAIEAFEEWMERFFNENETVNASMVEEGVAVASVRRSEMKELIRIAPATALALTVPYEFRRELPKEVINQLETVINTHASFDLLVYCPEPGQEGGGLERLVSLKGQSYQVFTFGRGLNVTAKNQLPIRGIAIDDVLAMAEDPIRTLSESERSDRSFDSRFAVDIGGNVFAVSEESLSRVNEIVWRNEATLGPRRSGEYQALMKGEINGVDLLFSEDPDRAGGDPDLPKIQSAHTEGPKTMLYIRARFSDQAANYEPNDLATLMPRQAACEAFWHENSYGKSSLSTTFTDVITLPNSASYYADLTSGRLNALFDDALPLVRAAGTAKGVDWDESNYDFFTMLTTGGTWGYAGVASVGGRRSHLNGAGSSNIRTASHEFGHNLGLRHANYWRTDSTSPIGRDTVPGGYVGDGVGDERIEYGHKFSVMGAQNGGGDLNEGRGHYTTGEKVHLDWLVEENTDWMSVDASTPVPIRLYRHDVETEFFDSMIPGVTRGIKVNQDSGDYADTNKRRYWLSYRRLPTNGVSENWLPFGVQVDWQRETYGNDGSILLDMTPFSNDSTNTNPTIGRDNPDKEDAVLVIGRTFSDEVADIHFTPIGQGGDNPNEWLDVIINIGTQNENSDPEISLFTASSLHVGGSEPVSFEVSAEDPDGDTIYYSWNFGDGTLPTESLNATIVTKSWNENGFLPVRVTASDGKGGTDTKEILIDVSPSLGGFSIQGRVLHAGLPVENARVTIENYAEAWTDGDGVYILPGLSAKTHLVSVSKDRLDFESLFINPVYLFNLDVFGRDWVAIQDGSPGDSMQLAITPYNSVVPLGTEFQLTSLAWDEMGKPVEIQPSWSVSGGGTISGAGVFTATELGGPYTVTAEANSSEARAFVSVEDIKAVGIVALKTQVFESNNEKAVFKIQRYGSAEGELQVYFDWGGEAVVGKDYLGLDKPFVFSDGERVKNLVIDIVNDFEVEPSEDFFFALLPDDRYTIYSAEASAVVTILDDSDVAPSVQITSPVGPLAFVPEGTGLLIETEVSDDGLPDPPGTLIYTWSVNESPPGAGVWFSSPQSKSTVAEFGSPGFYRVGLTVTDGVNHTSVELGVHAGLNAESEVSADMEVVYYSLDEGEGSVATDLRGGDNNGQLINEPVWTEADGGIFGGGLRMDGVDDRIDIPGSNEINLSDHSHRTIALWFKAEDPGRSGKQVLYEEGGGTRGLNIYLSSGELFVGGWNGGGNSWEETYLSTELIDSVWHHVVLVLQAEVSTDLQPNVFKGYLNGREFGSGSAATLDPHSGEIALGGNRDATRYHDGNANGSGDHFKGWLDEFHLWNRALTSSEVGQLFSRGYTAPKITLSSLGSSRAGLVVPKGVGLVLKVDSAETEGFVGTWTQTLSPEGGVAEIANANGTVALASFSEPGYYQLRYSTSDGVQKSAFEISVLAGLEAGSTPDTDRESLWYSFDEGSGETVSNNIPNNAPGEFNNGVSWSEAGLGILGSAVVFDGLNDYIRIPPDGGIGGDGSQKSISLWVKPNETATGTKEVVYEEGGIQGGLNIYIEGDVLYFGGWSIEDLPWNTFLSAPIERGVWHHVVGIHDVVFSWENKEENGLQLYLDGTLVGSGEAAYYRTNAFSTGLGAMNPDAVFHDGPDLSGSLYSFNGMIDELHIYDEYALSIDEIGGLYAFGNIAPVVDAGPDQPSLSELKVSLSGSATDDGRWVSPLTYEWLLAGRSGAGIITNSNNTDAELDLFLGGNYEVALSAFDGQVTTFDTVTVSVDQPTYFDQFMDRYPTLEGAERDYLSNPDNDLWTNMEEYGFGGAPDGSGIGNELWIKHELVKVGDAQYFEFRFPRRLDAALRGLSYNIQFSQELLEGTWTNKSYTVIEAISIDDSFEEVRIRVDSPVDFEATPLFGRVRILLNE